MRFFWTPTNKDPAYKVGDRVWFELTACPNLTRFKRAVVKATIVAYLEDTEEYEIEADQHFLPRIYAEERELMPITRFKKLSKNLRDHVGQHCIVHNKDDVYWRAIIVEVDPKRLVNDVHIKYEIEYETGPDDEWVPFYKVLV